MSNDKETCTIDDWGTVARGKSKHRPRNDPSLYGGKYPFIQTGDVKQANFYVTEFSQTYNEKGLAQSKLWQAGTLCITIAANIADTAILKLPAAFPDSIIGFLSDKKKADTKFVKYCLDAFKQQIQSISHGTTQDNLSLEKLRTVKFKKTPLKNQKKIAAVLSAYDDLIENNNRRIAILEKMAEEIYKEWFVRMRFPGYEKTRFVKGIPVDWTIKTVMELIDQDILYKPIDGNHGERHPKGDDFVEKGIPFIMASDFKNGFIDFKSCKYITQKQSKELQKGFAKEGDVLISHKATIGRTAIVEKLWYPYVMLTPQVTYYRIKNSEKLNNIYLKYYFDQKTFQELFSLWASVGGTRSYLGITAQQKLPILIPSRELMILFKEKAESLIRQKEKCLTKNYNLKQTRDRLLTRLISGKLSVADLDIRFPRSMKEESDAELHP